MLFTSKKISLLTLVVTALIFSRAMFAFFNDPEGPNLLVVTGMAAVIYVISLAAYFSLTSFVGRKKLLVVILVQLIIAITFYFCLR